MTLVRRNIWSGQRRASTRSPPRNCGHQSCTMAMRPLRSIIGRRPVSAAPSFHDPNRAFAASSAWVKWRMSNSLIVLWPPIANEFVAAFG